MLFPVLMYHRLEGGDRYSVSEYDFSRQMFFLFQQGFRTLLPCDLDRGIPINGKSVMITFDDGFMSDWQIALPLMKKYGFRGVSFIATGYAGREGYMDWDRIRALGREGFAIGSHTHSHALLNTLDSAALQEELDVSRRLIREQTGQAPACLALPGGGWKRGINAAARRAGFARIFTSEPGLNEPAGRRGGIYRRILIGADTSLASFLAIVNGDRTLCRRLWYAYHLRRAIKTMLGPQQYHSLWSRYYKQRGTHAPPLEKSPMP